MKNSTVASWINGLGVTTIVAALLSVSTEITGLAAIGFIVFAFIGAHRLAKID